MDWKFLDEYNLICFKDGHIAIEIVKHPTNNWYTMYWYSNIWRTKNFIAKNWEEARIVAIEKIKHFIIEESRYWDHIKKQYSL